MNYFILLLVCLIAYITYILVMIKKETKKERFTNVNDMIKEIKDEIKKLNNTLSSFKKKFNNVISELETFDVAIEKFFVKIEKFKTEMASKLEDFAKNNLMNIINNFFNKKNIMSILSLFGGLIKNIFMAVWKTLSKNKEFRYVFYMFIFMAVLPFLYLLLSFMNILSLFIPTVIVAGIALLSLFLIYINFFKIISFAITYLTTKVMKIDWIDIFEDMIDETTDAFQSLFKSIFK